MRKTLCTLMLAATVGLAGCGDSVQNNMQRAQIAVNRAKFDHALELADQVLAQEPDNLEAAQIKAQSLLQLGRLDQAYQTLDGLIQKHPGDAELRQLMVRWGWMSNAQAINQSNLMRMQEGRIVTDTQLVDQIDKARQVVQEQADWLATTGEQPAVAEYARAELADLRSRFVSRHLNLLRTTVPRTEEDIRNHSQHIQQLEAQLGNIQDEVQSRLASTLRLQPDHQAAALRYNMILRQRKQWATLWTFLEQNSERENQNEALVSQLVLSLLEMPRTEQTIARRLELGWKLAETVPTQRRQNIDWWLTNARLHMMAGQYAKATPLLEQARSKAPRNNDVRYLLASCHYHQNQFKQANDILKDLAVELKRSPNVALLHGMTLRELGDSGAREALRHAIDLDPDNPIAREQMILLINAQGNADAALQDLQAMYDRDPSDPRAIRFMLQFLRSEGDTARITELLTRVERINPRRDEYLPILVDGYTYLRQYKQAETTAREWVSRSPDALPAHMRLAQILLAQNKHEEARKLVTSLQSRFTDQAGLEELLGTLYLQQRSYDNAIEHLENALANDPTSTTARLRLAQAQLSLVLTDDALENVEKILEQNPTDAEALGLASRIYQLKGQADKSAEMLARINVNDASIRRNPLLAAQIKARAEQYDEAINILNQAIFAGNDEPALRLLLAAIHLRQENPGEAENQLLNLVRSQPDNWLAYSALASYYVQQQAVARGITTLASLEQTNPLLSRLAQAGLLARSNQHARALELVGGMLQPLIDNRDPRTMTVAAVIASLHNTLGQPEQARQVYQSLINAGLNVPQATLAQIDLDIARNQDRDALVKRLHAVRSTLPPEQRALLFQVARRLSRLGDHDGAVAIVDNWLAQTPEDVSLLSMKGNLLLQANRPDQAAKVYQQAVERAPENAELWLRLGQSHHRSFQFPQAEQALQSLAKLGTGARAAALTELGQLYSALGLNQPATAVFEELDREGNLRDPRVMYAMGLAAQQIDKPDVAIERLEHIPKASSLYGPAQIRIAQMDQARGRTDQARQRLSSLARDRQTANQAAQALLNLSMHDKNNEELIRWSDQMLSLESLTDNQRLAWLDIRATLAVNRHDWTGAAQALDQILRTTAKPTPRLVAVRILMALRLNQTETARNLFQNHPDLANSPLGVSLGALMGTPPANAAQAPTPLVQYYSAIIQGDLQSARNALTRWSPQPLIFKQDLLAALDRPDVATPPYKEAIGRLFTAEIALALNLNPLANDLVQTVLGTHHGLAMAHSAHIRSLGQADQNDRQAWDRITREAAGSQMALMAQSHLKTMDKDYVAAAQSLKAVLDQEPENAFLEYRLAGLLIRADQIDPAITLLEKIIQDNNRFLPAASNDLAYILATHKPDRLDEARQLAAKAQQAMPNSAALLDTVGWIEHLGGQDDKALPLLVRAASRLTTSAEVHYHLGVVYAAQGNRDWARYHLEAASSLPDGKDIPGLADALRQLN